MVLRTLFEGPTPAEVPQGLSSGPGGGFAPRRDPTALQGSVYRPPVDAAASEGIRCRCASPAFRPGHPPSLRGTDAPRGDGILQDPGPAEILEGPSGSSPGFGRPVRCRSGLAPSGRRAVQGEPAAAARLVLQAAARGRRRKRRVPRYRPPRWGCGSLGDRRPHRCRCRGRQVRLPARDGRKSRHSRWPEPACWFLKRRGCVLLQDAGGGSPVTAPALRISAPRLSGRNITAAAAPSNPGRAAPKGRTCLRRP